jgi:O-antigen/teichoic acid export membrane protein
MNLMTNLDVILIGYFLSSSSIGFYRSVQPLSRGLTLFLGAFTFLYLPIATDYFESGNHTEMDRIYKASTKWILFVTYPLALLFVFFSPEVILTLYDERYLPASTALSVLAIGMFLRAVVGPNGATIKAINKTKIDLLASIVGLVTNLLLNIYLIPKFGFVGAAIATSFSFLAFNLVDSLVVYLTIGVHPFSIHVFKQLVPSGIGAWYLSTTDFITPGLGNLILLGVILTVFHLLSYFLTGSLDRDDVIVIEFIENKTSIDMNYLK